MDDATRFALQDSAHELCEENCGKTRHGISCPIPKPTTDLVSTENLVARLMDIMAEKNCSLLQANLILKEDFNDQLDTASKLIRQAFEEKGHLTHSDKTNIIKEL
jgi:hypothetical protein